MRTARARLLTAGSLALALSLATSQQAGAQQAGAQAVPEYAMKATYLYNFMVFAEWPNQEAHGTQDSLQLCVFGPDNFGAALNALEGKSVHGRKLAVQRASSLASLRRCHLLFVTEREAPNMAAILQVLGEAPVLTVADSPLASGAAILLSLDGQRLVFDVNLQRIKKAGITLSSKVLQLARSAS
ncbi:YfiR family protein [Paucibacter soli]|uniref:YfiR family protein n=1 Tax=Paucibacter soli TaxID=3133433 RepID=UPI0030976EED